MSRLTDFNTSAKEGWTRAVAGGHLEFEIGTLCIHGDNPNALSIAQAISTALEAEGIEVRTFPIPEVPA